MRNNLFLILFLLIGCSQTTKPNFSKSHQFTSGKLLVLLVSTGKDKITGEVTSNLGTAFHIKIEGRVYLFTAKHVLDNIATPYWTISKTHDLAYRPAMKNVNYYEIQYERPTNKVIFFGFKEGKLYKGYSRIIGDRNMVDKEMEFASNFIVTNKPFGSGNSGGPVLDSETGKVIGLINLDLQNHITKKWCRGAFTPSGELLDLVRE